MPGIFTAAGKQLVDDMFGRFWASVAVIDEFGIAAWESDRIRNDSTAELEVHPLPLGGPYWVVGRLWESRTSDELLFELYLGIKLDEGDTATFTKADENWITFGNPPPPPPPEPSASGSD